MLALIARAMFVALVFASASLTALSVTSAVAQTPPPHVYDLPALHLASSAATVDPRSGQLGRSESTSLSAREASGVLTRFGVAAKAVATDADEAVFWSGIRGGAGTGSQWAASNGGATLESTIARGGIKLPAWDPSNVASVAAWRSASREFAAGARGNVRVLQDDAVRVRSIWAQVEYPALTANPRVTSITAVNPRTGVTKVLWSR
jgi:hypothetical protein